MTPRAELSVPEEAAWEAGRDAARAEVLRMAGGIRDAAHKLDEDDPRQGILFGQAATLDLAADATLRLRPCVPNGLESRG